MSTNGLMDEEPPRGRPCAPSPQMVEAVGCAAELAAELDTQLARQEAHCGLDWSWTRITWLRWAVANAGVVRWAGESDHD